MPRREETAAHLPQPASKGAEGSSLRPGGPRSPPASGEHREKHRPTTNTHPPGAVPSSAEKTDTESLPPASTRPGPARPSQGSRHGPEAAVPDKAGSPPSPTPPSPPHAGPQQHPGDPALGALPRRAAPLLTQVLGPRQREPLGAQHPPAAAAPSRLPSVSKAPDAPSAQGPALLACSPRLGTRPRGARVPRPNPASPPAPPRHPRVGAARPPRPAGPVAQVRAAGRAGRHVSDLGGRVFGGAL